MPVTMSTIIGLMSVSCVSLCILFVSLKLPSTGVTTLGPFVTSGRPSKYFKNVTFWVRLYWMQLLLLFYYPTPILLSYYTYFQFDLCFFPKNSKVSFFSSFLNFSPSSKLELMMSIVCGCLSAQVKSTIFQIATCKVSQVKWENGNWQDTTTSPCSSSAY